MATSRILFLALLILVTACDVEVKVKVGNTEKSASPEKPWQVYATNKETKKLEVWWSSHESHNDCMKSVKYDLTSSIDAQWYTEPAGCVYVGSDNRYVLYVMNKLYNSRAFMCVARLKNRSDAVNEFMVIVNGAPKETDYYRCVLPE